MKPVVFSSLSVPNLGYSSPFGFFGLDRLVSLNDRERLSERTGGGSLGVLRAGWLLFITLLEGLVRWPCWDTAFQPQFSFSLIIF